ncbi:MAG TPA: DUF6531 domain-containing protein [Vitreimonas sp.]|nr:DUF6531 domain-containing protein [Vitreimonas sp.]
MTLKYRLATISRVQLWLVVLGTLISLTAGGWLLTRSFPELKQRLAGTDAPEAIDIQVKQHQIPYVRQAITPQGGTITADQTTVVFPEGYSDQKLVNSYRVVSTPELVANHQVSQMFDLKARTEQGVPVTQFNKPLEVKVALDDQVFRKYRPDQLALYFFNEETKKWEKLADSRLDVDTKTLVATTTHFTVFMVAAGDPNQGVTQPTTPSLLVDDSSATGFAYDGQTDDDQPAYGAYVGSGYNGNALYTGNSINNTPHNWATWSVASGLEGEVEVKVTIPNLRKPLTRGAKYIVTHAGGQTPVTVDQEAYRGGIASLGTFTFNGSGSVYLNDVVPEKGSNFKSHLVFDAVSFGGEFDPNLDITPPEISEVKVQPDNGMLRFQAKVTDDQSGVNTVALYFDPDVNDGQPGAFYEMQTAGDDYYYLSLPYQKNKKYSYYILATDNAGNEQIWDPTLGYVTRGSFMKKLGYYPGSQFASRYGYRSNTTRCSKAGSACKDGTQGDGDPVNTLNGNLIEQQKLVIIPGRPELDLHLTYNSQGAQLGLFGQNWMHSYSYHVLEMDNPDFQGAFVHYPDGKVVTFSGPDFTPEAGYFEKLTKTGAGYELSFPDLTKVSFDAEGDITRWQDANGNGLTFSYGKKDAYTLMSQISTITSDGGRSVSLEYSDDGLVAKVVSPENKTLAFDYDDEHNLVAITDGNQGTTNFEYDDLHRITKKITPAGHVAYVNQYDGEGRVTEQVAGVAYKTTFAYNGTTTTTTDANNHQTTFIYNDKELLSEYKNAQNNSITYEYTDKAQVAAYTDLGGGRFEFRYDDKGNLIYEKDPLGYEVTREFNTTFNKPTKEIFKQSDHVTQWAYDAKGNLTQITNAKGDSSTFEYDSFGQLTKAIDFNGNVASYTYTVQGDVATTTDGEGNTQQLAYDGLGRLHQLTNARQFEYTYTYDGNDNLTQVAGPASFSLKYQFDANNRLVAETDANGGVIRYSYDASENLTELKNQLGFTTAFTYGPMNEKVSETSPEGHVSQFAYDEIYNLTSVKQAVGTPQEIETKFVYNAQRDKTQVIDPEGRITAYTYDPLHRLTKEVRNKVLGLATAEQNVTTEFRYSPSGALLEKKDANGNVTTHTYDQLDQLLTITDAEQQLTTYTYDKQGNVIEQKNPRGFVTKYEFNKNNQVAKIIDARSGVTTFTYDPNSNLAQLTDANAIATRFAYDALDRRSQRIQNAVASGPNDAQTNVTTKYAYDPHGNLTVLTNPRGFTTNFVYDAAHRNTSIIDAQNAQAGFEYDRENNLKKITDRNGHTRHFSYDALNRVTKVLNPENHAEEFGYDKVGNTLVYINPRGIQFKKAYDPLYRLKVATDPYTKTKEYKYDAIGNVLSLTDENGHTDQYEYDKVYRLRKFTDAEGNQTEHQYDANSNVVKVIDGESNPTSMAYDELDRLIEKTNAENETEKYAYDKTGNVVLKTEADGTPHHYTYDPLYRLAEVANNFRTGQAASHDTNVTTRYRYDANSNLVAQVNPLQNTTSFEYDSLDRLSKETNPLDSQWRYRYDKEGNVTERVDANGAVTAYQYYPDDVLAQIQYPSHQVKYQYSETNHPVEMVDNLGTTKWSYDNLDRIVEQVDPFNRKLAYEYDHVGNLTKLTYPDGRGLAHAYLKNDWLKQSQGIGQNSGGADTVKYARNKVGAPVKVDHSNSSWSQIAYDKVYRPLEVHDRQQGGGNHLISKFNYEYNDIGHITKQVDEHGWRQPAKVTTNYQYDGLHRLTNATTDDNQSTQYAYDAAGNRTVLKEQLHQGLETRTYAYNAANQLTGIDIQSPMPPNIVDYEYQYDKNGNRTDKLIADATGIDRGVAYNYDYENRLTKAQDYQVGGPAPTPSPVPTPTPTPTPTPVPSPSASPSPNPSLQPSPLPSISPSPSLSPCPGNSNGKNDGKDQSGDCNNGGGNDNKKTTGTVLGLATEASPSPSLSPSPSPSLEPVSSPSPTPEPTAQPTLQPENSVIAQAAELAPQTTQALGEPTRNDLAHTDLEYDGNGRRLVSTYSPGSSQDLKRTEYLFDRLDPVVEYSMWNGQRNNLARNSAQDLLFFQEFKSEQDPNGTIYWYHHDGEGNIAATTKHKAQSDHTYRYDEYGGILPDNGSGDQHGGGASGWIAPHNQYTLTQKQFDANTDLYYFGARHYDPEVGTWITQDSYRGQLNDPQSLHRYMYNNDSPVNYRDYYGYCSDPALTAQGCGSWTPDIVFKGTRIATTPFRDYMEIKSNEQIFGRALTNADRDVWLANQKLQDDIRTRQAMDQAMSKTLAAPVFDCLRYQSLAEMRNKYLNMIDVSRREGQNAELRAQQDQLTRQKASQAYYYIPAIGAGYAFANAYTGENVFTGTSYSTNQRIGQVGIGTTNFVATVGLAYTAQASVSYLTTNPVAAGQIGTGTSLTTNTLCQGDCSDEAGQISTGTNVVYRYVENGITRYYGITNDFARRAGQHLTNRGWTIEKIPGLDQLSRQDARAVEQVLIEQKGLPNLYNQINSISTSNPVYSSAIIRGNEIINTTTVVPPP